MPPVAALSKDLILDAAEQLFARQGYAATTIKQIGTAAGVNSALLYYYFADKETLYREMLRRLFDAMIGGSVKRLDAGVAPEIALRHFVEFQVALMAAHPHFPKLLVRELVDHDAAHAEEQISHLAATTFRSLCRVIEQGQRQGRFRADLDPRFAAISTVAQVAHFFVARPAIGLMLGYGKKGPPPDVVTAFARHAADFTLAALAVPDETQPRRVRKPSRKARS